MQDVASEKETATAVLALGLVVNGIFLVLWLAAQWGIQALAHALMSPALSKSLFVKWIEAIFAINTIFPIALFIYRDAAKMARRPMKTPRGSGGEPFWLTAVSLLLTIWISALARPHLFGLTLTSVSFGELIKWLT